jgi:hypothetical protein
VILSWLLSHVLLVGRLYLLPLVDSIATIHAKPWLCDVCD